MFKKILNLIIISKLGYIKDVKNRLCVINRYKSQSVEGENAMLEN